jgi:hypothetical protein
MSFADDFYGALQSYNEALWPMIIITFFLGVVVVYLAARKSGNSSRVISTILSFLWIWSGVVFFVIYYGPMDVEFLGLVMPGVWYLGGLLFFIQGVLFLVFGVVRSSLSFKLGGDWFSLVGALIIVYGMVIYPLVGFLSGYAYPRYPVFGIAPCPLTIFTLGLLQWFDRKLPIVVTLIPFIWGLMGIMPVLALSVWADIGEISSAIIGFPLILYHNSKLSK